jgi:putative phage-type endonuclease
VSGSTIARPPDTADWLEARRPYFNASAAAALFHEHPFLTLAGVVHSKLEPGVGDVENAAMRRGRHLEAAIASWWSEEHGLALYEPDVMYAAGPLLATLDRRIVGTDTDALEIKTTAKYVTGPERYWWWQVQAQMYCADLHRVHVAVLDASMSLATTSSCVTTRPSSAWSSPPPTSCTTSPSASGRPVSPTSRRLGTPIV